jgi:hypothetical protein
MTESMLQDAKGIIEVLVGVGTLGAGLAGAWWFLYTTQFKPRLQFDLGCRFRGAPDDESGSSSSSSSSRTRASWSTAAL